MNDIDPHFFCRADEAWEQQLGRGGDPPQAVAVQGDVGSLPGGARLHLDKGQCLAAPGDQIDLADGSTDPLSEDAPALAAKVPGRGRFRASAPAFGFGPRFAQRPSSSART